MGLSLDTRQAIVDPGMMTATTARDIELTVDLAGLQLRNPTMTASGTCGYGLEYAPFADLSQLGAFVTKSITPEERKGNEPQRIIETRAGMLNAIGLANVGLKRFVEEKIPELPKLGVPVIVNVAGHSLEDYLTVCRALDPRPEIAGIELNVSCPNVSDGLTFGTDPVRLHELVGEVRKAVSDSVLIVKLSPNVTDITATARACVDAGADVLSLVNTFVGMAVNIHTHRPMLANRTGGLSGPAIKPLAVAMVHQVYTEVAKRNGIPIIGMGGIQTWQDAVEFILAGASSVAIGTALFVDPQTPIRIVEGLRHYLQDHGLRAVSELVGQLKAE